MWNNRSSLPAVVRQAAGVPSSASRAGVWVWCSTNFLEHPMAPDLLPWGLSITRSAEGMRPFITITHSTAATRMVRARVLFAASPLELRAASGFGPGGVWASD